MEPIEFSADGIRGIAGEWPLTPDGTYRIGYALGRFLKRRYPQVLQPLTVMGRDTRPSGRKIVEALKKGLLAHDVKIVDLGVMTTPGVAFICKDQKAQLGIIITASHNPAQYNGIKLVDEDGRRLSEVAEQEIMALVDSAHIEGYTFSASKTEHGSGASRLIECYIREQIRLCGIDSLMGLTIFVDCANGATARVAPKVFKRLKAQVISINDKLNNGKKINAGCGSEYARENPQSFVLSIQKHNADYGFAFDGDGDRLVIADADGNVYNGDDFLYILATYEQRCETKHKFSVVTTAMANTGLANSLNRHNIDVVFTDNGDKNLERKMQEIGDCIGAEQAGNVIVKDGKHAAADSLYAALMLLRATQYSDRSMEQLVSDFQKHPQILATVRFTGDEPNWKTNDMPVRLAAAFEKQRQSSLEMLGKGARIIAWRSTTEPEKFNVMIEGGSIDSIDLVREQAVAICETVTDNSQSYEKPTIIDLSSRCQP
jgi:phosphoglucosamine mutase